MKLAKLRWRKKNNKIISTLFMYLRFSVIITNAMVFGIALSAGGASETILSFINFFQGKFNSGQIYQLFMNFYTFIIIFYILSTCLLLFIYLVWHGYFVRNKLSTNLSKFEILGLVQYLIFTISFIILLFVGFGYFKWIAEDNDILLYGIPLLNITIIFSTLILNIFGFVERIWSDFTLRVENENRIMKRKTQTKIFINIQILLSLSLILILWGEPDSFLNSFNISPSVTSIFQYIDVYITIIYLVFSFLFIIIWYALRIKKEKAKKIATLPTIETVLNIYALGVYWVFLLSTSVISMWNNVDQHSYIFLGIIIIDTVFTLPVLVFYILYYSRNIKRISYEK